MAVYLGIDPGKTGYMATLDYCFLQVTLEPIPRIGRGYDLVALERYMTGIKPGTRCVIEHQQAFPGMGSATMFSLGYGYGALLAMLTAHGIAFEAVKPNAWKRALGISAPPGLKGAARKRELKARSIAMAQRLFPTVSLLPTSRCRVASHDMAEALLLAEYARRTYAPR
jgi:hypothetical protein